MKRLVAENFRGAIVRRLLRRRPELDLVRVPDVGLGAADDPTILAWAATEDRLVLTHDAATLIKGCAKHKIHVDGRTSSGRGDADSVASGT